LKNVFWRPMSWPMTSASGATWTANATATIAAIQRRASGARESTASLSPSATSASIAPVAGAVPPAMRRARADCDGGEPTMATPRRKVAHATARVRGVRPVGDQRTAARAGALTNSPYPWIHRGRAASRTGVAVDADTAGRERRRKQPRHRGCGAAGSTIAAIARRHASPLANAGARRRRGSAAAAVANGSPSCGCTRYRGAIAIITIFPLDLELIEDHATQHASIDAGRVQNKE
jgi:hypothetical protein